MLEEKLTDAVAELSDKLRIIRMQDEEPLVVNGTIDWTSW